MSAHRDDDDPTGIRHLLSGMSDPAPMSEDLVRRISADIEHERRDHRAPEPLTFDPAVAKPHGGPRVGVLVAVLGAALLLVALPSVLALLHLGAPAGRSAQSGLILATTPTSPAVTPAPTTEGTVPPPAASSGTPSHPHVHARLVSSGTDYRSARWEAQVHDLIVGATPASPVTGVTPHAVHACLGALGMHDDDVVVDLATYDGRPALLIVAPAHDEVSTHTATVMPRLCSRTGTAALAGPRPVR